MNETLKTQLQSWFGIGFLDLVRLTWESPACILEKVKQYEAVHAIPSWNSLKQRLGPGRLCYAFFHRGMPMDPLVFLEVALVNEISSNVQSILNDPNPGAIPKFDTAIFYSITSSQLGLFFFSFLRYPHYHYS